MMFQPESSFADTLFAELSTWEQSRASITSSHILLPRSAVFARVSEDVQRTLPGGIGQLYSHQALVLEHALLGEHMTLATPTASGKTLALALSGHMRRTARPEATTMCIAPTRVLVEQWTELMQVWQPQMHVASYTGDTPRHERRAIRRQVQFLVTTPDMLHVGILPYHDNWHGFLSRLEDVYVDEGHEYSGVFGSHMALILRRLRRVVLMHRRTEPTFLIASATIGNPAEHAELLLGHPVTAITETGAPSGGRRIVIWQPPDERGHSEECARLMAFFVARGVRTIVFGQARQSVERMVRMVRDEAGGATLSGKQAGPRRFWSRNNERL